MDHVGCVAGPGRGQSGAGWCYRGCRGAQQRWDKPAGMGGPWAAAPLRREQPHAWRGAIPAMAGAGPAITAMEVDGPTSRGAAAHMARAVTASPTAWLLRPAVGME
ncbi:hypothetical protein [Candidatus Chloroploca sp. Khr17]|uniref:hypothetical protein n=1 Tax=Candidatus Chloroploca sp. Khr17 TaxID=2496869 RepID=UPI00101D039D|nr:hypothetical protein [Candidatus Chloroploca sp. Khr17]